MLDAQTSFSRNEIFGGVLERLAQGRHEEEDLPIYLTPPYRPRRVARLPSRQLQHEHGISPFHHAKLNPLSRDERHYAVRQSKTTLLSSPKHEPWWDEFIDELGFRDETPIRRDPSPSPSPPPPPPSPTPLARPSTKRPAMDQGETLRLIRPKPTTVRFQTTHQDSSRSSTPVVPSPLRDARVDFPTSPSPSDTRSVNLLVPNAYESNTSISSNQHGLDMLVLAALGSDLRSSSAAPSSPVLHADREQTPLTVEYNPALPSTISKLNQGTDKSVESIQVALEEVIAYQQEDLHLTDGTQREDQRQDAQQADGTSDGASSESATAALVLDDPKATSKVQIVGHVASGSNHDDGGEVEDSEVIHSTGDDASGISVRSGEASFEVTQTVASEMSHSPSAARPPTREPVDNETENTTVPAVIETATEIDFAQVDDCPEVKAVADRVWDDDFTQLDDGPAEAILDSTRSPSMQELTITLEVKKELADRERAPSSPLTPTPDLKLEPAPKALRRRGNYELNGILTLNERQAPVSLGDAGHDLTSRRRKRTLDHAKHEQVKQEEVPPSKKQSSAEVTVSSYPRVPWSEQEKSYLIYFALSFDEERCKAITSKLNSRNTFQRTEKAIRERLSAIRRRYKSAAEGSKPLSSQVEDSN